MRWPFPSVTRLFRRWAARRHPPGAGPVSISRRRIYILPTRLGAAYASLVVVLLLGATNYSNSLIFMLAFALVGLGLVCMHHTHRNLMNLRISARRSEPVFAGTAARFPIGVHNPGRIPRFAVTLAGAGVDTAVDIEPGGDAELTLAVAETRRGKLQAPRFTVQTTFPLGLFRAWTYIQFDTFCWIYPSPDGSAVLPPPQVLGSGAEGAVRAGDEEFHSLRTYRAGDPIARLHWKTLDRSGEPMIKRFASTGADALRFDWNQLPGLDQEARLSRLCRWVLDADHAGAAYGLRLPAAAIAVGTGADHRHRCLQALALHPEAQAG